MKAIVSILVSILAILSVCALPVQAADFIRGDANADGMQDISDPISTLSFLFSSMSVPCLASLDSNADDMLNIADPVHLLGNLFGGGSPPTAPYPDCGPDPSTNPLPCESFPACPDPDPVLTWEVMPNSPVAPYYHHDDLCFPSPDIGFICNISGEIWKTTDAGDSWTRVLNQPGSSFRSLTFVDTMKGWVGNLGPGSWVGTTTDPNVIYATTDGGINWTPISTATISGPTPDGICGIHAIGDTIHGAGRYAGGAYYISSTDGGVSWVSQNLNTDFNAFVDVLFFTPDEGYITGADDSNDAVLLHTTDGGANWAIATTSNAYHYWKVGFASATFGYAVCWSGPDSNKWVQTYDGGQTWTDRVFAGGYEANGIGFLNEQIGWISGHEDTTYETLDGGDSWNLMQIDTVYGDGINKFLRISDTLVYAVGNRIYKYADHSNPITMNLPESKFDNSLCTLAATANPSSESTTIEYTVPEAGHVRITVYIRGGLIYDRIVDEDQIAGAHTVEFTAHDDTPLLYAAIAVGRYRQTIKFANQRGLQDGALPQIAAGIRPIEAPTVIDPAKIAVRNTQQQMRERLEEREDSEVRFLQRIARQLDAEARP